MTTNTWRLEPAEPDQVWTDAFAARGPRIGSFGATIRAVLDTAPAPSFTLITELQAIRAALAFLPATDAAVSGLDRIIAAVSAPGTTEAASAKDTSLSVHAAGVGTTLATSIFGEKIGRALDGNAPADIAEKCAQCDRDTAGFDGSPKWCCYCGAKLTGIPSGVPVANRLRGLVDEAIAWIETGGGRADSLCANLRKALASAPVAGKAQQPVAWRIRHRSEPGMIGHYPWTHTDRIRGMRMDAQYEYEPLYAAPQAGEAVTAAARDVLDERQRQISAEGFGASRDDFYTQGELADAAACYAAHLSPRAPASVSLLWPWPAAWWKPSTYRHNLVKAGALVLAEIERLDRVAPVVQLAAQQKARGNG